MYESACEGKIGKCLPGGREIKTRTLKKRYTRENVNEKEEKVSERERVCEK